MDGHLSPIPHPGRHLSLLLALVVLLFPLTPARSPGQTVIAYGQTVQGTISTAAETDQYQFAGQSGDRIFLHVNRVSGFQPRVQIFRPDGSLLTTVAPWSDNNTFFRAWLDSYTLPTTGTYTIYVGDDNATETGAYLLTLQRSNAPANARTITYGEIRRDTISLLSQIRVFQFSGQSGDRIFLHVNRIAGLQPRLQIFGPSGILVSTVDTWPDTGATYRAWLDGYTLLSTGTFTVFIADDNGAETGEYVVTLQRSSSPANPRTIAYGDTRQDTIALPAQIRVFQFAAVAGDRVALHVNRISGIQPRVQIFRPDGVTLITVDHGTDSTTSNRAWLDTYAFPSTGTYTLFITDDNGAETGDYIFTLQRSNNPAHARTIVYGETRRDTISQMTQISAFQFAAQAGDRVVIRVNRLTGFQPRIHIYAPSGSILATVNTWSDSGAAYRAWLDVLALPTTGSYTMFILDDNGVETGESIFTIQRSNNTATARTIAYGETRRDTITDLLQIRAFQFTAQAGDRAVIRVNRLSGLQPRIDLFGQDGALLSTVDTWPDSGASYRAWLDATAIPANGACTIFIADDNGFQTGEVIFTLQRSNDPPGVVDIISGDTAIGRVLLPTQMTAFSTVALPGDTVWAWAQRDSGSIDPRLDLFTYNGSRWTGQADSTGSGTVAMARQVVPDGGGVWVLVGDDNGYEAGRFRISLRVARHTETIVYGQTVRDSIVPGASMRRYAFVGQAKDRVILHCNGMDRTLNPLVGLYEPDGSLLAGITPNVGDTAQTRTWVDSLVLKNAGLHVISVMGMSDTEEGIFCFTLQRSNHPAYVRSLSPGDSVLDSLHLPTQINTYPFTVKQRDTVRVVVRGDSLRPILVLEVYRPDGTLWLQRGGIRDTSGRYRIDLRDSIRDGAGTYALMVRDSSGYVTGRYTIQLFIRSVPVSVHEIEEQNAFVPATFGLLQNYPNPFNPVTTLAYDVPRSARVRIAVYDVLGREVSRPVDEIREPGRHRVVLDGTRWASGAYLCVMRAGDFHQTMRLLLVK